MHSQAWNNLKRGIIMWTMGALIADPLFLGIQLPIAKAETSSTPGSYASSPDDSCLTTAKNFYENGTISDSDRQAINDADPGNSTSTANSDELGGEAPFQQVISITDLKNDPHIDDSVKNEITSTSYIQDVIQTYGQGVVYYTAPDNTSYVLVCYTAQNTLDTRLFNPVLPLSSQSLNLLTLLQDPSKKIDFDNPADLVAVTGEVCAGGLISTPIAQWTDTTNPCPGFQQSDDKIINGKWDAPKVDIRVAQTLAYLVTPVEQGGAGREYIRVKKIVEPTPVSAGTTPVQVSGDTTSAETLTGFTINPSDPPHKPKKVASAVQISQIDKIRTSTKTTTKKIISSSSKYTYQAPFPVNVGWQTDQGISANPPPDLGSVNVLGSGRVLANQAIVDLMNKSGLGDMELDTSKMDVNNFGDVAQLVGQSLLEQVTGAPGGSLTGWDLTSTLESIGRASLAKHLGLLPGALSKGNDYQSIVANIGQNALETTMGFPLGSLSTANGTSSELLTNLGHSYLENQVFKVSPGTLSPSTNNYYDSNGTVTLSESFPLTTISDTLERLGEGRIEQVFKLPHQSLRKFDYSNTDKQRSFRDSSFKTTLLFPKTNGNPGPDDFATADWLNQELSLAFNKYGNNATDMYGFSEADYARPLIDLETGAMSLAKFKQLVGARVVETSLGQFHLAGTSNRIPSTTTYHYASGANGYSADQLNNLPQVDAPERTPICAGDPTYINNNFHTTVTCVADSKAIQSNDLPVLGQINQFLVDTTIVKRNVFTPDESIAVNPIPYFSVKVCDTRDTVNCPHAGYLKDNGKPADYEFTQDLLAYYNDPRLLKKDVPLNQIDATGTGSGTIADSLHTTTTPTLQPTSVALQTIFAGDTESLARLSMIKNLAAAQLPNDPFNLDSLRNDFGSSLDAKIADRINLLTTRPAADPTGNPLQYGTQYANPAYNGWQFLVEDLIARLNCRKLEGHYTLESIDPTYTCKRSAGSGVVDQTTASIIDQVKAQLAKLQSTLQSMNEALVGILDQGGLSGQSINGTCGLDSDVCGVSGWSSSIGIPGQSYSVDLNNKVSLPPSTSSTPNDPMRSLFAPSRTPAGIVSTNTRVSAVDQDGYYEYIGRLYAAKQFTKDPLAQRTLVSQLETGLPTFESALKNLSKTGLLDVTLNDRGLDKGDFSRIFQLDLSDQVFNRIGKQELLRVLWNKSGATSAIKNSDDFKSATRDIEKLTQDITFYQNHLKQIRQDTVQIQNDADTISTTVRTKYTDPNSTINQAASKLGKASQSIAQAPSTYKQACDLEATPVDPSSDPYNDPDYEGTPTPMDAGGQGCSASITTLQTTARLYEPDVKDVISQYKIIKATIDSSEKTTLIKIEDSEKRIEDINHLLQEMAAGKTLPRTSRTGSQKSNKSLGSSNTPTNECLPSGSIVKILTRDRRLIGQTLQVKGANFASELTDLGIYLGGCKIDQGLGLPSGSFYGWYLMGKVAFPAIAPTTNPTLLDSTATAAASGVPSWGVNDWGADNLAIATGIASSDLSQEAKLDVGKINQYTATQINALKKKGDSNLGSAALAKLAQLIPGVSKFAQKEGLTSQDLAEIFKGNTKPLVTKIGARRLDSALDLPAGTGEQLIFPQCKILASQAGGSEIAKNNPCDNTSAGTNPDNIRVQILAQAAFKKLGLTIPAIPVGFDILGGNLAQSWGNARVSQQLSLAPNSFSGALTSNTITATPGLSPGDANYSAVLQQNVLLGHSNAASVITDAFGLTSPIQQGLKALSSQLLAILNAGSSDGKVIALDGVSSNYDQYTQDMLLSTENDAISGGSSYWNGLTSTKISSVAIGAGASYLATSNYFYLYCDSRTSCASHDTSLVGKLWSFVGSTSFYDPRTDKVDVLINARKAITQAFLTIPSGKTVSPSDYTSASIPDFLIPTSAQFTTKYQAGFENSIIHFQNTVSSLNSEFGFAYDQGFTAFLQGKKTAEDITSQIAIKDVAGDVLQSAIDKYIDDSAPKWLKDINADFKVFTKDLCSSSANKDGVSIGTFIAGSLVDNANLSCVTQGVSGAGSTQALYDPKFAGFRNLLFNQLGGRAASTKLETELGIQRGTFQAIVTDPRRGSEILITQGIFKLSDQIFGGDAANDSCRISDPGATNDSCQPSKITHALKDAFMAGFYNVDTKQYTLEYSLLRSTQLLTDEFIKQINIQFDRITQQYLGVQISGADLSLFIRGDGRFFSLVAAQYTANTINKQLLGDQDTKKDPNVHKFLISYNDVRQGVGIVSLTPEEKANAERAAAYAAEDKVISGDTNTNAVDYTQLVSYQNDVTAGNNDWFETHLATDTAFHDAYLTQHPTATDPEIIAVKNSIDQDAIDLAPKEALARKKTEATNVLKYKTLDALAFKADHNIPVNFSERLFSGSQKQQASAISDFVLGSLISSNSNLKTFLTSHGLNSSEVGHFATQLITALTAGNNRQTALKNLQSAAGSGVIIAAIDAQLNQYLANEVLHVPVNKLPPGMFTAIYNWGVQDNFALKAIGKPGNIGRLIGDYVETVAYTWGDRQMGLPTGTSKKIGQIAVLSYRLYKTTATALTAAQDAKKAVDLAKKAIDSTKAAEDAKKATDTAKTSADSAKAASAALKVAIFEIVKDVILSGFQKNFEANDAAIGVPAGTLSQVAGLGITALAMHFGLIAYNPATIYIAVAVLVLSLLFGTVKIVTESRATADGYYPYHHFGQGGGSSPNFAEHHTTDPTIGEFNPNNSGSYKAGVQLAARAKVRGLLRDLLLMPTSKWAQNHNIKPEKLWISQAFAWGDDKYNPMNDSILKRLMNRNAPWQTPADYGYGDPLGERCTVTYDANDEYTCVQNKDFLSGFYASPITLDVVHVRW